MPATSRQIYDQVQHNIDTSGQHVFGIFPDNDAGDDGFYYTIGNAVRGLPELLLVGSFEPNLATFVLNTLGDHMRKSERALPEGLLRLPDWPHPFKIRKTGWRAKTRFTIQASRFHERDNYEVLQVMLCDPKGRFPGDPGCDKPYNVVRP